MQKNQIHKGVFLLSLLISIIIISFFWFFNPDISKKVPPFIIILAFIFIILEMFKKAYLKINFLLNRLYYIGLFAIIAPIALADKLSPEILKFVNQIGVLFILTPIILERKIVFKKENK